MQLWKPQTRKISWWIDSRGDLRALLTNLLTLFTVVFTLRFQWAALQSDRRSVTAHISCIPVDHTFVNCCIKVTWNFFQTVTSTCALPSSTTEVMWECNLSPKWHLPKSRSCPPRATSHQAKYFPSAKQQQWSGPPPNFNCIPPSGQYMERALK